MNDAPHFGPARSAFDQDWRKVVRYGLVLGFTLVFISLTGMPDGLNGRVIVEPWLSMGYLSLLWVPLAVGFAVTYEPVLEGMVQAKPGGRELVAGAAVGLIGGLCLSLLVYLLDSRDLSDPLVNWNQALLDLLTRNGSVADGVVLWTVAATALGFLGGLMRLLPPIVLRVVRAVLVTVIGAAAVESLIDDLSEEFKLEGVVKWLYHPLGGLEPKGAIALAIVAAVFVLWLGGQVKKGTAVFNTAREARPIAVNSVSVVAVAFAAIVLPMFLGRLTNDLLVNVGLFVLLALGLNIVVGLAGILDLGYVAFYAVGGYTIAILTSPTSPGLTPAYPFWLAIFIVVGMATLAGLFIGAPVIRMRGDYLAIVTLGFGEIIRLTVRSDWASGLTGGAQGVLSVPGPDLHIGGWTLPLVGWTFPKLEVDLMGTNPQHILYVVMFFVAIAIYVSWRLENSRIGRAWMAVREDESVAEAMGINTVNAKLQAFVTGAILASFAGAVFAAKVGSVFESSFKILVSIVILVIVIVGGMGRIAGVIAGAFVLVGILGGPNQPGLMAEFSEYKLLIYGALLVWMMLKRPEGLIPNVRRSRELHLDEFLQDAWLRGEVDRDEAEAEAEVDPEAWAPPEGNDGLAPA
ncbi:MAG: hypothetical protein R8F63_14990 [Acidimicrobiales bacterium]|nr:hypothetical protein [Acidimicrobiales bacterium]